MKLLRAFIDRLKRVPTRSATILGWVFGRLLGIEPEARENPRYEQLRRLHDSGQVDVGDFERLVVPLLIERGKEIARLRHILHRSIIENRVLYVFAIVGAIVGYSALNEASQRNTQAIRVSCIVTANVVVRAGGSPPRRSGGPTGQPAVLSDPQKLSALRTAIIRRAATPAQRREERRLLMKIGSSGGLDVPPCDDIAMHPEKVKPFEPNASRP